MNLKDYEFHISIESGILNLFFFLEKSLIMEPKKN